MKTSIFRRLKNRLGETLVETMAAILIVTLSSIILLTMANTAGDINRKAAAADKTVEEQMIYAEMGADKADPVQKSMTITVQGAGDPITLTETVDVYQEPGNTDALYSYSKHIAAE